LILYSSVMCVHVLSDWLLTVLVVLILVNAFLIRRNVVFFGYNLMNNECVCLLIVLIFFFTFIVPCIIVIV